MNQREKKKWSRLLDKTVEYWENVSLDNEDSLESPLCKASKECCFCICCLLIKDTWSCDKVFIAMSEKKSKRPMFNYIRKLRKLLREA